MESSNCRFRVIRGLVWRMNTRSRRIWAFPRVSLAWDEHMAGAYFGVVFIQLGRRPTNFRFVTSETGRVERKSS